MDYITMYDSIYPAQLPAGAQAYAGYVGGHWPTYPVLARMFPSARLLSIAVTAAQDADCLDVETGDATLAEVPAWHARQRAAGAARPAVYTSAGNVDALAAVMTAAAIPRSGYRIWSAHYTAEAHICGPATCRATAADCDGTQWSDTALGRSLDVSLLAPGFFPQPAPPAEDPMIYYGAIPAGTTTATPAAWPAGSAKGVTVFADTPGATVHLRVHHETTGWYAVPEPLITGPGAAATYGFGTSGDVNGVSFTAAGAAVAWHTL